MKKWVLRFRAKDKILFDQIVSGEKTVETRANTSRYSPMKRGAFLVLICGKEKQIKSVRRYKSIDEMAKAIEIQKVIPNIKSVEEAKKIYFSFPGYREKIERFGIVAFEI